MLKYQIKVNGEIQEVSFNEFRSWTGHRYINDQEYHSPFIYNHLTLQRAPREQARACPCAICQGHYNHITEGETERLKITTDMEEVRARLFLRTKRAGRREQETLVQASEVVGLTTAYDEILEDTFKIEGAVK